jgi:hypothetical protein
MKYLDKFDQFSEGLQYHLENRIPLSESVYRFGSESWIELVNEVRSLYESGIMEISPLDEDIINSDIGQKGIFEGQEVILDCPFYTGEIYEGEDVFEGPDWVDDLEAIDEAEYRGKKVDLNKPFRTPSGPKKFAVYTKNDKGNIVKVTFGIKGMRVRNADKKRAKSFQARMQCDTPGPKWKPRWWACNVGKFSKALSLSSSRDW